MPALRGSDPSRPWCITRNQRVYYAYGTVLEPDTLTLTDRLILHALGVSWVDKTAQNSSQ
jgi:hypothetical protein